MVFGRAAMDDYVRRLGIHSAAPLPCTAHSVTEEESRAAGRRHVLWAGTVLLFFAFVLGLVALAGEVAPDRLPLLGVAFGVAAASVAFLIWLKLRKKRDYRDPRIRIEIGSGEVTVMAPAVRDARRYEALVIAKVLSGATKSSRYFIGIELDTKLGPIRLEDEWFSPGKAAAGAILKRMDELGLPLVPKS